MALAYSHGMTLGTLAPAFNLPGTDGHHYGPESFADAAALVLVFTCNHCQYAQAAEQRLIRVQQEFRARGVRLCAISSNDPEQYPEDSFSAMTRRSAEQRFNFPYLYDETQDVARAYDAACTPDIFVFDGTRRLAYNGRLDDNWKDPKLVTRHDLRDALDAVLAGRAVAFDPTPSMGCAIKWKPRPAR